MHIRNAHEERSVPSRRVISPNRHMLANAAERSMRPEERGARVPPFTLLPNRSSESRSGGDLWSSVAGKTAAGPVPPRLVADASKKRFHTQTRGEIGFAIPIIRIGKEDLYQAHIDQGSAKRLAVRAGDVIRSKQSCRT